jgi:hypothetical protein
MEASEHPQLPQGAKRSALRQVDPVRLIDELAPEQRASGFDRLNLMVNAVFPRLASEPGSRPGR